MSVRWCPLSKQSCKRFWNFCITCCSMVGEIAATSSLMLCLKSTVVLGFFSYTLLLSYPQSKKSQMLRSGNLAGHSIFPLHESRRAGNISLRTCIAALAVWAVAPSCWNQRVWFSTPSLQHLLQKCAKHLSVAGWIYCYWPACLVFKEIGSITPKDAAPHQTISFSDCKGFWWVSRGFSVAQ